MEHGSLPRRSASYPSSPNSQPRSKTPIRSRSARNKRRSASEPLIGDKSNENDATARPLTRTPSTPKRERLNHAPLVGPRPAPVRTPYGSRSVSSSTIRTPADPPTPHRLCRQIDRDLTPFRPTAANQLSCPTPVPSTPSKPKSRGKPAEPGLPETCYSFPATIPHISDSPHTTSRVCAAALAALRLKIDANDRVLERQLKDRDTMYAAFDLLEKQPQEVWMYSDKIEELFAEETGNIAIPENVPLAGSDMEPQARSMARSRAFRKRVVAGMRGKRLWEMRPELEFALKSWSNSLSGRLEWWEHERRTVFLDKNGIEVDLEMFLDFEPQYYETEEEENGEEY